MADEQRVRMIAPDGATVEFPAEHIQTALSKNFRLEQGSVLVSNPQDGAIGIVPEKSAKAALDMGWVLGQPQTSVEQTKPYNKVQRVASSAAGTGAERMGIPQSQAPVRDTVQQLTDSTTPYAIGAQASPIKVPAFLANFIGSMGQAQGEQFGKAKEELKNAKDVATDKNLTPWQRVKGAVSNVMLAETHAKAGLVPFAGPATANAGEDWKQVYDNPNPENVGNAIGGTGAAVAQAMMLRGGAKPEGVKPTKILSQGEVNPGVAIEKTANLIKKYTGDVNVNPKSLMQARGETIPPVIEAKSGKIPQMVRNTATKAKNVVDPVSAMPPSELAMRAIKPSNKLVDFPEQLQNVTLPATRRAAEELHLDVNKISYKDTVKSAQKATKDMWNDYERNYYNIVKDDVVDVTPVADAMVGKITQRMREQKPGLVRRIEKLANNYRDRKMTISELENDFLKEANNESSALEGKFVTNKAAAKQSPQLAYQIAERDAFRNVLLNHIKSQLGDDAANVRRNFGAMKDFTDSLLRRKNVAERQAPLSLNQQIARTLAAGQMVAGAGMVLTGNPSGLGLVGSGAATLAAARAARRMNDTGLLLRQALQKTEPMGVPPLRGRVIINPPEPSVAPPWMRLNQNNPTIPSSPIALPAPTVKGNLPPASSVQQPAGATKPSFLLGRGERPIPQPQSGLMDQRRLPPATLTESTTVPKNVEAVGIPQAAEASAIQRHLEKSKGKPSTSEASAVQKPKPVSKPRTPVKATEEKVQPDVSKGKQNSTSADVSPNGKGAITQPEVERTGNGEYYVKGGDRFLTFRDPKDAIRASKMPEAEAWTEHYRQYANYPDAGPQEAVIRAKLSNNHPLTAAEQKFVDDFKATNKEFKAQEEWKKQKQQSPSPSVQKEVGKSGKIGGVAKHLPNPWREAMAEYPRYKNDPKLLDETHPKDIWYHGTTSNFDQFKTGGIKRATSDWNTQLGVHFTADESVAGDFASGRYSGKKDGGRVIQAKLRISNPKEYKFEGDMSDEAVKLAYKNGIISIGDIRKGGAHGLADELAKGKSIDAPNVMYHDGGGILQKAGTKRLKIARLFINELKKQGYDGIIYGNTVEGTFGNKTAIVLDPSQIDIIDHGRTKKGGK